MFSFWSILCLLSLLGSGGRPSPSPANTLDLAQKLFCAVPFYHRAAATRSDSQLSSLPAAGRSPYQVSIWATYAGTLEQRTLTENAGLIDEVNFVWYTLRPGGKIDGSIQSSQALQAAREAGLRVVPSIANAGFQRDIVLEVIADPADRSRHVAELVALVEDNDFDGIDIDYESLAAEDRDVFSLFIEELASALHARGRLLSIAVHAKTDDAGTWGGPAAQDWARLGAAVDEFKIMTYDYHWSTSEPGPIAPLAWVDEVLTYAATVVPPEKTWLGVHFYGYDWVGSVAQGLEWQQVVKRLGRTGAEVRRDQPGEAWFRYDDDRHTVYFTDAQALAERLAYVFDRHPNLAGIAIWRLGGEDPANWPAIQEHHSGK
jgi:spore germination protein YaaH